ncbi:hypothetical protein EDD30_6757 [Couchioplanes caeruleus]|uniref:YbaB/EbfC DNA-binding family protein n=1 Tax=Couchioplanes caeruleus TaxID=56438 RepID=A0A3N1GTX9_9ACTN|nr:hypothetical protein EDD30_6757 [Couchioplanes caeruleus]
MMGDDMMARLVELQAKVTQFGELAAQLASAIPKQTEGSDATGSVLVVLGSDGLPDSVTVRNGWHQRLQAADLGAAIMQANGDAVRRGMTEWTNHLDDTRRWQQQKTLDEDRPRVDPSDSGLPPAGVARESSELTEGVLEALHKVQQPAPAVPHAVEGTDPGSQVTVTLGAAGPLSCAIDADWAATRDGESISSAVNTALRAARDAMPARHAPGADLDGLLGDALATLQAVTRPRPATGENP